MAKGAQLGRQLRDETFCRIGPHFGLLGLPFRNPGLPFRNPGLPFRNFDLPFRNFDLPFRNFDLPFRRLGPPLPEPTDFTLVEQRLVHFLVGEDVLPGPRIPEHYREPVALDCRPQQ